MLRLFAIALLAGAVVASAADGYVGSRTCAPCHPAQFKPQSGTGHAQALRAATPQQHTAYRPPDYRLEWKELTVTAINGQGSITRPLQWAFGAGAQAITFVSQFDEDRYLEHHLSWYASNGKFALTPGHRATEPSSLEDALGVLYRTFEPDAAILRCFRCHSTGPLRLGTGRSVQPFENGVRCEACHGPGESHARKPVKANIYNPVSLDGPAMNTFCGNCHRPPASEPENIDWRDPWNVRHQPLFLARSKCFTASGGKLKCTTCHDPHGRLVSDYKQQCLTCHSKPHSAGDCVSCHMPKVKPHPALAFTNHWIR